MHYTSNPSSVLYAKLVLVRRPISRDIMHYALVADADRAKLSVNKASYTKVLPVDTFNAEVLPLLLTRMRDKYNFADVHFVAR